MGDMFGISVQRYRRWVPWKETYVPGRCLFVRGWRVYPEIWDWRMQWIQEANRYWRFQRIHVGPLLIMRMERVESGR